MPSSTPRERPLNYVNTARVARLLWRKDGSQPGRFVQFWVKVEQAQLDAQDAQDAQNVEPPPPGLPPKSPPVPPAPPTTKAKSPRAQDRT